MSYVQYNEYFRKMTLMGMYRVPQTVFPLINFAPNLSNECSTNPLIYPAFDPYICSYYDYYNNLAYNPLSGQTCHPQYYGPTCGDPIPCIDQCAPTPFQDPSVIMNFRVIWLTSNLPLTARFVDTYLHNPWGIIIANDIIWVCNSGNGLITKYNLLGEPIFPVINVFGPNGIIAQPTAIAINYNTDSFLLINGANAAPSNIIVCTRNGTINGYSSSLDLINSILVIDNSANDAVYTGIAIVYNILYVADFYNQRIDVFDGDFVPITTFPFIDEFTGDPIPEDYAPYNVTNIGEHIYVLYALQSPIDNQYEMIGQGNGYVSIFTLDGRFIRRFASNGSLNAPWGLILSPSFFSYPAGSIMISNFGDGTIDIFDSNGKWFGKMKDGCCNVISIEGLRAINVNPNYDRVLYWSANGDNQLNSFIGTINARDINLHN